MNASTPPRGQIGRFFRVAAPFVAGFVLLALGADWAVGTYIARRQGRPLIGREVYLLKQALQKTDPAVEAIYLGDSVARQIFPPGENEAPGLRHVTSNQAISLAGQYYLLQQAVWAYPNLKHVTLLYTTRSWRNNLDQVYTSDYFCGYFTEPHQVVETFRVKRDVALLGTHVGRSLLPNLSAMNSWMSLARAPRAAGALEAPRDGDEDLTSARFDHSLVVSPVSLAFVERMRALCASKAIEFRVYACPVSDEFHAVDEARVYDAPILHVPAQYFGPDKRHLKKNAVPIVRSILEESLPLRMPRLAAKTATH